MKSVLSKNSLIALLFCSPLAAQQQVIRVSPGNSETSQLIIHLPIDGYCFMANADTLQADHQTGYFSINNKAGRPGFASVSNKGKITYFYIYPDKLYNLSIEIKSGYLLLIGNNPEAQNVLDSITSPSSIWDQIATIRSVTENLNAQEAAIKELVTEKEDVVRALYKSGKIQDGFRDALLTCLDIYQTQLLSTNYRAMLEKVRETKKRQEEKTDFSASVEERQQKQQHALERWGDLYSQLSGKQMWAKTPLYSYFLYNLVEYNFEVDTAILASARKGEDPRLYIYDKYLTGSLLELAYGWKIYNDAEFIPPSEKYAADYSAFTKKFPGSQLTPLLRYYFNKSAQYFQNIADNRTPQFLNDYEKITSFDLLRQKLKGKITYIDIWATWCEYCLEELKYAPKLHPLLDGMNIQTLFLSLDTPNAKDYWLKMLKGLNLGGLNMLASEDLRQDMNNIIPDFNGIPRYIIIGKNGEVLEWNAERPSSGEALINQLKKYANG